MSEPTSETLAAWNALAAKELEGRRWMRHVEGTCRYLAPFDFAGQNWIPADGDEMVGPLSPWPIPPYNSDLNAVARLEAIVISRGLRLELHRCLFNVRGCSVGITFATAAQRLEAVLVACGLVDEKS